jgi:hypothetical protein
MSDVLLQKYLSDQPMDQKIAMFTDEVQMAFESENKLSPLVNVTPLTGTSTMLHRRLGKAVVQKVQPGVAPVAQGTGHGTVTATVDTMITCRDEVSWLDIKQADHNYISGIATSQGQELSKFYQTALLIQAIKGSYMSAPSGLNGSIGAGRTFEFTAANEELDPDKLVAAIRKMITGFLQTDQNPEDLVIVMDPTLVEVASQHTKLISKEFSQGGDFAKMEVPSIMGAPIIWTNRLPTATITNHILSNAQNGNAFDITAQQSDTVVAIFNPKHLMIPEAMPITTDIHSDKRAKTEVIDNDLAFGVAPARPDAFGTIRKYRND